MIWNQNKDLQCVILLYITVYFYICTTGVVNAVAIYSNSCAEQIATTVQYYTLHWARYLVPFCVHMLNGPHK